MPGHRGGPFWDTGAGPFTIDRLVDGVCAQLDAEGIGTAHVVGNSLGGWVALELVRRGRARSAVAISPAGGWRSGWDLRRLLWTFRVIRAVSRPAFAPVLAGSPALRRALLRKTMEHGERIDPALVARHGRRRPRVRRAAPAARRRAPGTARPASSATSRARCASPGPSTTA